MKAYEDFVTRPPKFPANGQTKEEQLRKLELSSVCFERGCESVTTRRMKKNSHAIRKFTPKVRQGKVWREMGGRPVVLSGSEERTHGKKVRHDGRIECDKIISFHRENMKGVKK